MRDKEKRNAMTQGQRDKWGEMTPLGIQILFNKW